MLMLQYELRAGSVLYLLQCKSSFMLSIWCTVQVHWSLHLLRGFLSLQNVGRFLVLPVLFHLLVVLRVCIL